MYICIYIYIYSPPLPPLSSLHPDCQAFVHHGCNGNLKQPLLSAGRESKPSDRYWKIIKT